MFENSDQATGYDVDLRVKVSDAKKFRAQFDPCQNVLLGPYTFADGVLAPKPFREDWESMGEIEYRALYYTLCKFNQLNRTGVEWKAWGLQADEVIYSYPDTTPYYFFTLFVFLDVFTKVCGPTARKVRRIQTEQPAEWEALMKTMRDIAGGNEHAEHNKLSSKQFIEMMDYWEKLIGIPKDLHGALADFLPGMCNIFRIRKCAVMHEYDRFLKELGAEPLKDTMPDPSLRVGPSGGLLAQAALFSGDGTHRLGMIKNVSHLPRVQQKLEVAKRILGYDILSVCVDGPLDKLESMPYNGVAMYMAGWAAFEKFLQEDPDSAGRIGAVAGRDVGEYVALSVAGVIPFEVGLDLAAERGKAMTEVSRQLVRDQATCTVAGFSEDRVKSLCEKARGATGEDVCQIASVLFPLGFVVGGRSRAVNKFHEMASSEKALQCKVTQQKAIHTPLMHDVQWAIKAKLREHRHKIKVPWCDVYFNACPNFCLPANGGEYKDPLAEVEFALNRFLCETCWSVARWEAQVKTMLDNKITHFIECGPSKAIRAMMKATDREAFENTICFTV